MELLERFEVDIYKPIRIYKFMKKVKDRIEKDLKLNREQEILFEYWRVCEDNISNDLVEHFSVYGFLLGRKLEKESKQRMKKHNL